MDDERSLEVVVPGLVAADREGLDLTVTRLEASDANKLLLEVDTGGSAILELGAEEGFFVFAHGKARLVSTSTDSGRAFVDAVAGWPAWLLLAVFLPDVPKLRPDLYAMAPWLLAALYAARIVRDVTDFQASWPTDGPGGAAGA